jgi:hypothetical protein
MTAAPAALLLLRWVAITERVARGPGEQQVATHRIRDRAGRVYLEARSRTISVGPASYPW